MDKMLPLHWLLSLYTTNDSWNNCIRIIIPATANKRCIKHSVKGSWNYLIAIPIKSNIIVIVQGTRFITAVITFGI